MQVTVIEVHAREGRGRRHAGGCSVGGRGGGLGGGKGLQRAALLVSTQVREITYLQVQAQGDEALPQHVQLAGVLSLAHQLLLAVGMVLQADQAAAQQVGLPLGHESIYTRFAVLIKAASVVSSM